MDRESDFPRGSVAKALPQESYKVTVSSQKLIDVRDLVEQREPIGVGSVGTTSLGSISQRELDQIFKNSSCQKSGTFDLSKKYGQLDGWESQEEEGGRVPFLARAARSRHCVPIGSGRLPPRLGCRVLLGCAEATYGIMGGDRVKVAWTEGTVDQ